MPDVTCPRCGDWFWRDDDERWKKTCLSCWKELKNKKAAPTVEYLQRRVAQLERKNYRLQQHAFGLKQEVEELRGARETVDELRRSVHVPSGIRELLPKLLQLTHPDKHNGSDLSNSVTAELLKLRKDNR